MAKRRKEKDEDEDKSFKIPKFDEKAFLKRERRNIKATVIAFLFGILMALVCFGFYITMSSNDPRWILVLLVAIFSASFLRYIYVKIKLDMTDFTNKNWFSSFAIYLFTWMVILIVLVNPPFYDDEAPNMDVSILPQMQELGGTVKIVAKITDNAGINKENLALSITHPDGTVITPNFEYKNNILRYTFESPDELSIDTQTYNYKIVASDNNDKKTEKTGTFSYSNRTITLGDPFSGDEVRAATTIKFSIEPDVNRAYYTVNDGKKIYMNNSNDPVYYESAPRFEGWPQENNITVSVNVKARVVHYFENCKENFNNTIVDTETYTFKIDPDQDVDNLGIAKSVASPLPKPHYISAPGFETLVFIISLIAVVLIFKYRKKDRRN